MESGEFQKMPNHETVRFDVESRDRVRKALSHVLNEVSVLIESSELAEGTKKEVADFLQQFVLDFEDDGIVERGWVTFDSSGNIIRARSAEGVYDVQNTFRYLLEEMEGKFFNPLSVSFLNESQKEMREVKNAVHTLF